MVEHTEEGDLFDLSPIPTWAEDFSAVRTYLASCGLFDQPEGAVREALAKHPEIVGECVTRVRILRANRACVTLHHAANEQQLLAGLDRIVCEESVGALAEQIVAIACGRTTVELDTVARTLDGAQRNLHLTWRVAPGFERTLARVIVCTEDVTDRRQAEAAQRARVRELTALTAIGQRLLACLTVDDVANAAVGALVEAGQVDAAFFYRMTEGELRFVAGAPAADLAGHCRSVLSFGECLCGLAFNEGRPLFVARMDQDPRCTRTECTSAGFQSYCALPILVDGQVLAVIGLVARHEHDLSPQREFFEALGGTVSLGLRNALFLERLQRHGDVLEQEISARRRAEDELRDEVALRESIIRSLPAVFYMFDAQGRFLRWNAAFEKATGRTGEELARTHPVELFTGSDKELVAERIAEVFARGESSVDASLVTPDGTRTPYYFTGQRLELRGAPCLIGVGIDLSPLVKAQRSLRDLSLAIEASGDVVFVTNVAGIIESVNTQFTRVYGLERDEVVGRVTPRILKSGHHDVATYEAFWSTIRRGEMFRGEVINRAKDGREVVVDETVSPFLDERGTILGFLAIQRDVTERKRIELDRQRLRDQLRESQKLEALGRLAGGVAHDFNNLLTVIRCYASLLAGGLDANDPRRGDLDEIAAASDRAAAVTGQLLAFSRRQVLEPRVIALNAVVTDMQAMLRRLLGEHIQVSVHLGAGPDTVLADEGQLGQVLLNLAVNARDAMPSGGNLQIETANVELDEQNATGGGVRPGRFVRLRVRDDGVGMDDQTLAHIFEPFFTTKAVGRGTGLGLATVYGIVTQSGGVIRASSELGRGTTFDVLLPEVAGAPSLSPPLPVVQAARGGETILLVEDEDAVRVVIERILRHAGYRVLTAADGLQALALVEQAEATLHLVLTDVVMPRMGGIELGRRLAETRPNLKLIFMSSYTDDMSGLESIVGFSDRFIGKPFTAAELTARIQRALGTRR